VIAKDVAVPIPTIPVTACVLTVCVLLPRLYVEKDLLRFVPRKLMGAMMGRLQFAKKTPWRQQKQYLAFCLG